MANQVERVFYGGNQVAGQEVSREDLKQLKIKQGRWQQPDSNFTYDPLVGKQLFVGMLSFTHKGHHIGHYAPFGPNTQGTGITIPFNPGVHEIVYTDAAADQATIWEEIQKVITDDELPVLVKRTGGAPAYPGRVTLYPSSSEGLGTVHYFRSPVDSDGCFLQLQITSSAATETTVQIEHSEIFVNKRWLTPPTTWSETGWDGAAIFQCIADNKNPILVLHNIQFGEKITYTLQKKTPGTTTMVFAGNFTTSGYDKVSFVYDSGAQTWSSSRSTETYSGGGSINYAKMDDNDLTYTPGVSLAPGVLGISPANETVYTWDNTASMESSKFATQCGERDTLVVWAPELTDNAVVICLSKRLNIHSGSSSAVLYLAVRHGNGDGTYTELSPVGDSVKELKTCSAYRISIIGNTYKCELLNDNNFVTDDEFAAAVAAFKSRIIYTIPIGAIDKVEKISMSSGTGEVRIHATLFNPNMNQDLNDNSNVVLNFGPNYLWADHLFFAIYEFDRARNNWVWVANTDEVNNNLHGIMHFPLTYRNVARQTLESSHLYLFCVCGNLPNEIEVMGNELADNINMNSSSFALATAKVNAGVFTGVARFRTDFGTLDLSTFSESAAQATVGTMKPVRVFSAITNLTNLP